MIKQKRKPGWKAADQAEAAWSAKINSMTLGNRSYGGKARGRGKSPVVNTDVPTITRTDRNSAFTISSKGAFSPETSKKLAPEVLYKENPEMLEREKLAQSQKMVVAPAYNRQGITIISTMLLEEVTASSRNRTK